MIIKQDSKRFDGRSAVVSAFTTLLATALIAGAPAANAGGPPSAPMAQSNAGFVTWHQGFEHDTAGWYASDTAGPLGWCGAIEQVSSRGRGGAAPAPSAGSGHATVSLGWCNDFWTNAIGIPFGAPYAPGPELALYSDAWPEAGYVTELDVYLDPAWSGEYQGSFGDVGSLVQYAATIFPTDYQPGNAHTGPHYFAVVEAVPGEEALTVAGYRIDEAGWYTLRFVFSDVAGEVWVDFELDARSGGTLATIENVEPVELWGPVKFPFGGELPTAEYGSGHVWFFDIAFGLELPIDEHRVRRGR